MEDHLKDRIAVVTGASRGLGSATALELASCGAFVYINYLRHEKQAKETLDLIREHGGNGALVRADVTKPEEVQQMFQQIYKQSGRVDILVNNAGATRDAYFVMMRQQSWDELIAIHLHASFYCAKAVVRRMCAARRGVIINIGSGSSLVPMPGQVNYSATKAGLLGFSRSLAREVAAQGVRVVHVAPGFFKTDMTELLDPEFRAETYRRTPMGRWGLPEELANVISFLASDDAAYITGQTIPVDGGRGAIEAEYGFE